MASRWQHGRHLAHESIRVEQVLDELEQHNAVELLGHGEFFRRALHNPGDVAPRMFRGRGTHLDAGQLDPRTADKPLEKEAITTPYIEEA